MLSFKNILIIANSGRMLAQLAKQEGYAPLVIDCFADQDTQDYALQVIKVNSLELSEVKHALFLLSQQGEITHVIYGSGFENHQSTLSYLEQNFIVLGNSFQVFSTVQDKPAFFLMLKTHNVDYPPTSFHRAEDNANWLIKPLAGEGGIGIKRYEKETVNKKLYYWQKIIQGTAKSVLFIANGAEYKIIGFHKQFMTKIDQYEFVFSGVMNQLVVANALRQKLRGILDTLVVELSLTGINSLDFIENDEQCSILEINARPSASINLYNSALFSAHINSYFPGSGLNTIKPLKAYKAYKIIFTEQMLIINTVIDWPSWVVDIPCLGTIIHTGEPICSIIAGGKNEQQVEDLLLSRQQQLMNLLR